MARYEGLSIGLVGVGPWGANILRDLRSLGVTVHAAVYGIDSRERARAGGAASITDLIENLPSTCDGYVIANRTISHLDAIDALLPRGAPIFVEKPIGVDVARVRALSEAAHQLVFVMHKWRYHPGIVKLAELAASGEFGAVKGLRSYRTGWDNTHADVSSLWVLAPHELSIALAILGEVPRAIAAHADPLSGSDAAIALFQTSSGIPAAMEVSSFHPMNLRRILLRLDGAVCQLDSASYGAVSIHRADKSKSLINIGESMPLLEELKAFLHHLLGGPPPLSSLTDELRIVEEIAKIEAMVTPA